MYLYFVFYIFVFVDALYLYDMWKIFLECMFHIRMDRGALSKINELISRLAGTPQPTLLQTRRVINTRYSPDKSQSISKTNLFLSPDKSQYSQISFHPLTIIIVIFCYILTNHITLLLKTNIFYFMTNHNVFPSEI